MDLVDTDTVAGLLLAIAWFMVSFAILALFVKLFPQSGTTFLMIITLLSASIALRLFIAIERFIK